jgi:hypothetical protein
MNTIPAAFLILLIWELRNLLVGIPIRNIIKNHMARKLVLIRKRGQLLSAKPIPPIAEPTNCTGIAK